MTLTQIAILFVAMLLTGAIGAITGGNSLINVPILIAFGMSARGAVATNMFAVIFMTVSATARFVQSGLLQHRSLVTLCLITAVTSTLGALLTVHLSELIVKAVVGVSMAALVVFIAFGPRPPVTSTVPQAPVLGLIATTLLGVYGGFFSGGYTTLMTFVGTACLGFSLHQSVAIMKPVNLVSCVVASIVFCAAGLIDLRVGIPLAVANLIGGYIGAHLALHVSAASVKRLFVWSVAAFAVKLLGYDVAAAALKSPATPAARAATTAAP
jgi:uncharacterized membrane protein YfcA